jgi:hypothetical protein
MKTARSYGGSRRNLKKPHCHNKANGPTSGRAQDSAFGRQAERSPLAPGNVCKAFGEVDTEPSTRLHEVVLPKGTSACGGRCLAADCMDEQYKTLLEEMAPIAEQVADKLNL